MKLILTSLTLSVLVVTVSSKEVIAEGRWKQTENKTNCVVWNEEPASNETVTWTGECKKGKADGEGKLVWRYYSFPKWKGRIRGWRESTYTGVMRGGKSNGHGVLTWPDGSKYDGHWKDNKREGKGTWISADGDKCDGIWRNQELVGKGVTERDGKTQKCTVLDGKILVSE